MIIVNVQYSKVSLFKGKKKIKVGVFSVFLSRKKDQSFYCQKNPEEVNYFFQIGFAPSK